MEASACCAPELQPNGTPPSGSEGAGSLPATTDELLPHAPQPVPLSQLPGVIQDLHRGMPPLMAAAPMRLMLIAAVLRWSGGVKVYEDVEPSECEELPYADVGEAQWAATVVLSWRWGAPKPAARQPGFSPMCPHQLGTLAGALRTFSDVGLRYVWIDWCCVPQYSAPSMVEVMRCKQLLQPPPADHEPSRQLPDTAAMDAEDARAAAAAVGSILRRDGVACRDYLHRVWPLAERMARYGRGEPLSAWLGLEAWLGMVADAVLAAAGLGRGCGQQQGQGQQGQQGQGQAAGAAGAQARRDLVLYRRILDACPAGSQGRVAADSLHGSGSASGGSSGSALLDRLLPLLATTADAAATDTGPGLAPTCASASASANASAGITEPAVAHFAALLRMAVRAWRHVALADGVPAWPGWLHRYLADMSDGVYHSSSSPARVRAVYALFSWKPVDAQSPAALLQALRELAGWAAPRLDERQLAALAADLGLATGVT
ncbi:hypothetical protein HXX76_002278 [Chlamydomonas incerta]|uniref:Heterokaryon incompatibility domain-containing protein n=1 Tax=Chlamydomonas incerta TaxID=51695 RepID=A0A835WAR7_CHLIN|nr:hypothetical protein HXX76_002278 [Chlamydomonas incerta]|eukprot:KAG2443939.1 hypothetical protein HXX76_002278 [Chlamydomonas incerta]